METLGQKLKAARERKGVTATQAAAATRIKVQHIESMERDDFSRMAAPTYAKGFIKIYAEYLDLDSGPLIREYTASFAPKDKSRLAAEELLMPGEMPEVAPETNENQTVALKNKSFWPAMRVKPLVYTTAGVLVVIVLVLVLSRCGKTEKMEKAGKTSSSVVKKESLPVIREPPEPYMEKTVSQGAKK